MTFSAAMSTVSETVLTSHQSISLASVVIMLSLVCYAGGRVHQYFRQGLDRDHAYREGYNTATRSLFALATRTSKAMEAPPPLEPEGADVVQMRRGSARVQPRHLADSGDLSSLQRRRSRTAWDHYKKKPNE
jgi:hypothetical protein